MVKNVANNKLLNSCKDGIIIGYAGLLPSGLGNDGNLIKFRIGFFGFLRHCSNRMGRECSNAE